MSQSSPRATPQLSANAVTVLEKRYLIKDDQGQPTEKPEDLYWRVATTIAAPDRSYGAVEGAVQELAAGLLRPDGRALLDAQLAPPS